MGARRCNGYGAEVDSLKGPAVVAGLALGAGGVFSKNKKSGVQLVSSFWPVRYRTFLCLTNGPKKKPALEVASRAGLTVLNCAINWVQGWDLNPGPSGYEPDELPGCSTLQ